jgi:hypothetical protein
MTHGIPIEVTRQLEQAIKDAFTHDELWVATRPMGDLHDEVTHANLSMEVVELVDWVEKRSRTPELLDCLLESVPGNAALQGARTRYLAAEEEAKKNPPADRSVVSSFADSRPTAPSHAGSKGSGGRFQAPPWAWMVLGALILIVLAFVFWGGDDTPTDSTPPMQYGDSAALDLLYDECDSGSNAACDNLFEASEIGSEYEDFGATCGGRVPDEPDESCLADLGP